MDPRTPSFGGDEAPLRLISKTAICMIGGLPAFCSSHAVDEQPAYHPYSAICPTIPPRRVGTIQGGQHANDRHQICVSGITFILSSCIQPDTRFIIVTF